MSEADERDIIEGRRVIVVGKSGNGKSSTGNSILGKEIFESKEGFGSTTQTCEKQSAFREDRGCMFTVVDTPGLFDTDIPLAKRALEIQKALEICPNPHAFLIVCRVDTRFTQDDLQSIDMLRIMFGEEFLDHSIAVFTRGGRHKTKVDFFKALNENKEVNKLKHECNKMVIRIENDLSTDDDRRITLTCDLFDCIENVSDVGTRYYNYDLLSKHRNLLEKHLQNSKPNVKKTDELNELVKALKSELENAKWRPYLIGGATGVATTVAGGLLYGVGVPALVAEGWSAAAASPAATGFVNGAIQASGAAWAAIGGYLRLRRF